MNVRKLGRRQTLRNSFHQVFHFFSLKQKQLTLQVTRLHVLHSTEITPELRTQKPLKREKTKKAQDWSVQRHLRCDKRRSDKENQVKVRGPLSQKKHKWLSNASNTSETKDNLRVRAQTPVLKHPSWGRAPSFSV